MSALTMSRETRICVAAFVMLTTGLTFNLIFFQGRRLPSPFETATIAPSGFNASINDARASNQVAGASTPQAQIAAARPSIEVPGAFAASERPLPIASAPAPSMSRVELVKAVQRALVVRGYEPGEADGIMGLMSRAAIMAYESDSGLSLTGAPSEDLLRRLQGTTPAPVPARRGPPPVKTLEAATIIRNVGQSLAALGYPVAKNETSMSPELVRAIRDYEASQKMPETGRISAALVARLSRAARGRVSQAR
ncbi:MAG: peptidoglycan-binding protein [Hyphomicrobium sp.]